MRNIVRMCFAVVLAVASVSCAFGKEESDSSPYHEDTITKTVIIPMIYGESDGNIMEAFVETDADMVVIKAGNGGEVVGMMKTLDYLRTHPAKRIIIDGDCYSACTDLLSKHLREGQVCFTKDSKFGFHSARVETSPGFKITPAIKKQIEAGNRAFNKQQFNLFDDPLQAWLLEHDAYASTKITEIDIHELQELTHKGCGNGNPLAHAEH